MAAAKGEGAKGSGPVVVAPQTSFYGTGADRWKRSNLPLEVGNIDLRGPAREPLTEGSAIIEVLCDRRTPLGNPFNAQVINDECDAFHSFLQRVLIEQSCSLDDMHAIAAEHRCTLHEASLQRYGQALPGAFREAVSELVKLCYHNQSEEEGIRLLCHCVPDRCHLFSLVDYISSQLATLQKDHVQPAGGASLVAESSRSECATVRRWGSQVPQSEKAEIANDATEPGTFRSVPSGNRRPTWGAAGVIAFSRKPDDPVNARDRLVCLVEKKTGALGFPKGRGEWSDKSPLDNAVREWREETNLSGEPLSWLNGREPFVDEWQQGQRKMTCHYFFAEWVTSDAPEGDKSWLVLDDPADPDPVVCAHWMSVAKALAHEQLHRSRKNILRQALSKLHAHVVMQ
eukprot:TRINITY_DN29683_c0_g1_i1.p1 TRINITY_DN29683_c0_g1~~TRINITY_DN29683_c0_g1_i1.p1  ORF type:complete len:400 (-),score=54.86 TRINITY_DN29683_c0_g1_i1:137-1336(-)